MDIASLIVDNYTAILCSLGFGVSISYFTCFYYPNLIFDVKKLGKQGKVKIIGHRGSRLEGLPENTIASFKDAISAGADVIELDVWLTKDDYVVVHHDDTYTRMTQGKNNEYVINVNKNDIPKIIPDKNQIDKCKNITNKAEWEQIPLFENILQNTPSNVTMIIEFKQDSNVLIEKVLEILNKYNRKNNIYWFSLDEKINKKLRQANKNIPTITSITGMLKILGLYYIGLLPFHEIEDSVFGITVEEITYEKVLKEKAIASFPLWIKQILATLLKGKPPYIMVAPGLFNHLKKRGIPVWFLGVNDEKDLRIAESAGATAVLTDRINWIVSYIKDNNIKLAEPL